MNSTDQLIDILNEKLIKLLPEQIKRPRYVTNTLNLLVKFIASDKSSMMIKDLNKFERKIIYVLCDHADIGIKYSVLKTEHQTGGSKIECHCGATGKENTYYERCYEYGGDSDSDDKMCEVCEDSGFVRNFLVTHITLTKS